MLLGISGSLRKGSYNTMLVKEAARIYGGPFTFADLRLPLYDGDLEDAEGIPPEVQRLADQIAAAEAVVISCPEYNKALSGVMKNALDWVSRTRPNPWLGKPLALMAATGGRAGGERSNFSLRLAMAPFRPKFTCGAEVLIANTSKEFDGEGRLVTERYATALEKAMDTLKSEATA